MDTDLLKPTQEDQMAEMMLLMQMDKLSPELGSGSPSDLPLSDFSGESRPGPTIPRSLYESTNRNSNMLNPSFHHNPSAIFPAIPQGNNCFWSSENGNEDENKQNSMAAMREMIFRIAAMQPIYIDPESVKPPKRRNVRISKDPQSVAARHRRERISERIRILQRLVPGGTKMDTASMLDEAIHYVKFLKTQVQSLERAAVNRPPPPVLMSAAAANQGGYFPVMKGYPVMQSGEASQHQPQSFSSH